jgi:ABC-2 type transport system ATP-binding protein
MSELLQLKNITKAFSDKCILNNVNLTIEPGMVVGLLGKNGAGKSTLMRIALGLQKPDSGDAACFSEPSTALSLKSKSRLGYVPQQPFGYEGFKVADALVLHASFYEQWDVDLEQQWLVRFGIDKNQQVDKLSIGQRQSLALIMAMAYRPQLLILDEPVASLDPLSRREFMSDLFDLALESHSGILFSSHITTDLERVASHIALLKDGELVLFAEMDDVKEKTRKVIKGKQPLNLTAYTVLRDSPEYSVIYHYDGNPIEGAADIRPLSLEQLFIEVHQK